MLEDPSIERLPPPLRPRASLVLPGGAIPYIHTSIWMGGAHTLQGETIHPAAISASWLVDCAGEMPGPYRAAAAAHLPCVFADLEARFLPSRHILPVVDRLAEAVINPGAAPPAVYIMCSHGMNRSGLVTGLLLRRLGFGADEAIARIRAARRGALSNDSFVDLIRRA
ncbi:MAG: hypothetical protein K6U88_10815 [Dehalococcoidia bacterium]|uniref:Tyrosine specific protein phosphatases domain-containing protein n=1 Tax=Tepidiforma bonchosmolovskayae TaxID=2601677 RepID=A0ABX6BYR1_9CHLR|nr:hypothetical protein [Tepidiforma bonchosmolovskayae]MCL6645447.1 hypothetical protein [Dehalococcoidia bacterium]QFG02117.1 hypothetical protein Tbon_01995 [Tepidiforma bonchosmolovskayae]